MKSVNNNGYFIEVWGRRWCVVPKHWKDRLLNRFVVFQGHVQQKWEEGGGQGKAEGRSNCAKRTQETRQPEGTEKKKREKEQVGRSHACVVKGGVLLDNIFTFVFHFLDLPQQFHFFFLQTNFSFLHEKCIFSLILFPKVWCTIYSKKLTHFMQNIIITCVFVPVASSYSPVRRIEAVNGTR